MNDGGRAVRQATDHPRRRGTGLGRAGDGFQRADRPPPGRRRPQAARAGRGGAARLPAQSPRRQPAPAGDAHHRHRHPRSHQPVLRGAGASHRGAGGRERLSDPADEQQRGHRRRKRTASRYCWRARPTASSSRRRATTSPPSPPARPTCRRPSWSTAASASPGFDTIAADNFDAAKRGCQHLLSLGHRDIVLVVSDTGLANIADRIAGYRDALGRGRPRRPRARGGRRLHGRWLPRRDRAGAAPRRPADRDLLRRLYRDARRHQGDPRARPRVPRQCLAAELRRFRLDDGPAPLCERGRPAGRRDGRRSLAAAEATADRRGAATSPASGCPAPCRSGSPPDRHLPRKRSGDSVPPKQKGAGGNHAHEDHLHRPECGAAGRCSRRPGERTGQAGVRRAAEDPVQSLLGRDGAGHRGRHQGSRRRVFPAGGRIRPGGRAAAQHLQHHAAAQAGGDDHGGDQLHHPAALPEAGERHGHSGGRPRRQSRSRDRRARPA